MTSSGINRSSEVKTPIHFLNTEQGNAENTLPIKDAPHLHYMTGARVRLWKDLIDKGVVDAYGKLTREATWFKVPPLEEDELFFIQTELKRPFFINFGTEGVLELSMDILLRFFFDSMTKSKTYRLCSFNLIGGYVAHLLFSQTGYVRRLLSSLKLDSTAYELPCFKKKPLADIDLRAWVQLKCPVTLTDGYDTFFSYQLSVDHLLAIRNEILMEICRLFKEGSQSQKPEKELFELLLRNSFDTLCTASSALNLFQVIAFKGSLFDFVFYNHLSRLVVFSKENLFLPLLPFFSKEKIPCTPGSFHGNPLQAIIDILLGITNAEHTETIDEKGLFRYFTSIVKGNYPLQKSERTCNFSLEYQLFKTMCARWPVGNLAYIPLFNSEMKGWLKKHHADDPLAHSVFILNASFFLQKYLPKFNMYKILEEQLTHLPLDEPTPSFQAVTFMRSLLLERMLPIHILCSFLQLCSFLIFVRKNKTSDEISIEIGSANFERPVLQLQLSYNALMLPCEPASALEKLIHYSSRHPSAWQEAECELNRLFLILCPPLPMTFSIDEEKGARLNGSPQNFIPLVNACCASDSFFLQYLGIVTGLHIAELDSNARRKNAEKGVLNILYANQHESLIRQQLELAVGKDAIPSSPKEFAEKWVETLFITRKESEEVAFRVWKKVVDRGPWKFSIKLISKLAHFQPSYASKMFSYLLHQKRLFENLSQSVSLIAHCRASITKRDNFSREQAELLDTMGKALLLFARDKKFQLTKKNGQQFLEFEAWFLKRGEPETAAAFGKCCMEQAYFGNENLRFAREFKEALRGGNQQQAEFCLQQALEKGTVVKQGRLHPLLEYFLSFNASTNHFLINEFIECLKMQNNQGASSLQILEVINSLIMQPTVSMDLKSLLIQLFPKNAKKAEEGWIENLFQSEHAAKETAYCLWVQMTDQGRGHAFSLKLIRKLIRAEATYAHRIYSYLKQQKKFEERPEEQISLIVACGEIAESCSALSAAQEELIAQMGGDLVQLVSARRLLVDLEKVRLFILWFKSKGDDVAVNTLANCVISKPNRNDLASNFKRKFKQKLQEKNFAEARQLMEDAAKKAMCTEEELFHCLIIYLNKNDYSIENSLVNLFKDFLKKNLQLKERTYQKAAEVIARWLQLNCFTLATKFYFTNLLASCAPAASSVLYGPIVSLSTSICDQPEPNEQEMLLLLKFMVQTKTFESIDNRYNLQNLLRIIFIKLTKPQQPNKKGNILIVEQLRTIYSNDLGLIEPHIWHEVFLLYEAQLPERLLSFFLFLETKKFLTLEGECQEYLVLYNCLIKHLSAKADRSLVNFSLDAHRHEGIVAKRGDLVFFIFSNLVCNLIPYVQKDPKLWTSFRSVYAKMHATYLRRAEEKEPYSSNIELLKGSADFRYITFLLESQQQDTVQEGLNLARERLSEQHTCEYWFLWPSILSYFAQKNLKDEFNRLLSKIETANYLKISFKHFEKIFTLLLDNPNPRRQAIGVRLWHLAHQTEAPLGQKSLELGFPLLRQALENYETDFQQLLWPPLQFINTNYMHIKKMGKTFAVQALELSLRYISKLPHLINDQLLEDVILKTLGSIDDWLTHNNFPIFLECLPIAIFTLARRDITKAMPYATQYWNSLVVSSAKTKRLKNKILLSETDCYVQKKQLMENLILCADTPSPSAPVMLGMALYYMKKLEEEHVSEERQGEIQALSERIIELNRSNLKKLK